MITRELYDALSVAQGEWTIEELARFLRVSKTAVRRALRQLDEAGNIALTIEEGEQG